ncbi:right-handed parallel beta-helix repeat-containing protein [Actinomadura macra]|uniref:right-handed parallel beta-helix repeat-containing protein n=1 Tax=Actinomadura macra TaxID=46164 RepID=UPI000836AA12|nr:right-handed parallel beta-helix repeat-containing protein [Actinomadura macra]
MRRRGMLIGSATTAAVAVGALGAVALEPAPHRAAPTGAGEGGKVVVHVAPDGGARQKAGLTVSSLAEAQQVLEEKGASTGTVLVQGGTYRDESVEWTYSPAGGDIVIRPEKGTGRVVYDGGGRDGYWLTVRAGSAKTHVSGITVQNYTAGGILFRGDKASGKRITGGSVRNMVFRRLGTRHADGAEGYGAVHMYNSWNMTIQGNDFRELENRKPASYSRIHGVYFSNGASRNTVSGNTFFKISGDPVRASDGASGNRVIGNRFRTTGWYGLFSYFMFPRDPVCGKDNYFAGNTYGTVYPRPGRVKSFKGRPVDWDKRGKRGACTPDPIKVGPGNAYAP